MAEKCIFQTHANEKRAVFKRLSFNQLLRILSYVQQAIISQCRIWNYLLFSGLCYLWCKYGPRRLQNSQNSESLKNTFHCNKVSDFSSFLVILGSFPGCPLDNFGIFEVKMMNNTVTIQNLLVCHCIGMVFERNKINYLLIFLTFSLLNR